MSIIDVILLFILALVLVSDLCKMYYLGILLACYGALTALLMCMQG